MVKLTLSYWNHCHLMPAEPLVLLNWLLVLLSMQCNCFLLKCWFDNRGPLKKWSLQLYCMQICLVQYHFPCPCVQCWSFCLFAPVENSSLLKKTKNQTAHISHPVVYVVCWCLSCEGFLKKEFEADPLSWFKREILYLFCTCIINQDVFNYFGCWNKACEVVYSVAEFSLSCFATVVKLRF